MPCVRSVISDASSLSKLKPSFVEASARPSPSVRAAALKNCEDKSVRVRLALSPFLDLAQLAPPFFEVRRVISGRTRVFNLFAAVSGTPKNHQTGG